MLQEVVAVFEVDGLMGELIVVVVVEVELEELEDEGGVFGV